MEFAHSTVCAVPILVARFSGLCGWAGVNLQLKEG